jgi:hypothetical protein
MVLSITLNLGYQTESEKDKTATQAVAQITAVEEDR